MRTPTQGRAPNYGRSFQLQSLYGAEQEVARVELAESRDLTIMLGDTASVRLIRRDFMPIVTIDFGNGGVGNQMRLEVPARGSVHHVTASLVVVRAVLPQAEGGVEAAAGRFSANIGFGRPSPAEHAEVWEVSAADGGGDPGVTEPIPLLPWVSHLQIVANPLWPSGTPTVPLAFEYLNLDYFSAVGTPLGFKAPLPAQPIAIPSNDPYTFANAIRIVNGDAANAGMVTIVQSWRI